MGQLGACVEQIPNGHLNGKGCGKCANNFQLTTEEWIEKAKLIHGNKYDYYKVDYKNAHIKVIIICKIHKEFEQTPNHHISKKGGCPKCVGRNKTTNEWIEQAKLIHGNKYDY